MYETATLLDIGLYLGMAEKNIREIKMPILISVFCKWYIN